jgi:hypothetical protein
MLSRCLTLLEEFDQLEARWAAITRADKADRAPPGILPDVRELKGKALFGSTDEAPRDK